MIIYGITKLQKTDNGYNRYDIIGGVLFSSYEKAENFLITNYEVIKLNKHYKDIEGNKYEIFEYDLE